MFIILTKVQKTKQNIPLTGLSLLHVCACPRPGPIFSTPCFYAKIDFMLEAIASVFILVKLLAITD